MKTYERMSLEEFLQEVNVATWRMLRTKENEILVPIGVPQRAYGKSSLVLDHSRQHMLIAGRTGSGYHNFINNLVLLTAFARNSEDPLDIWIIDAGSSGLTTSMMLCSKRDDNLTCDIPHVEKMIAVSSVAGKCATVEDLTELVDSKPGHQTLVIIHDATELLVNEQVSVAFHKTMQDALGTNVHFILGTERLYFTRSMYMLAAVRVCLRTSHGNSVEMLNDAEANTLPVVGYCVSNEHYGCMEAENSLWRVPYLDASATKVLRTEIQKSCNYQQFAIPMSR